MDSRRVFFERLAETWDVQQPPDREERLRRLLSSHRKWLEGARAVLEIGTGTGMLIPLLREASPAARVLSIDLAHEMLRRARARCPDAWLIQADAHALPFPTRTFDRAVCHNTFPHFQDKRAALAELVRVLSPAGLLLILHDRGREEVNAIHRQVGGAVGEDLLPPSAELCRLLTEEGFSCLEVEDTQENFWIIGLTAGRSGI